MKKILITGINGFIGSHLTDYLIKQNHLIYGIERPNQKYLNLKQYLKKSEFSEEDKLKFLNEKILIPTEHKNLQILECDIQNNKLLEQIIKKIEPDFIFHFAAQPYVKPSWEDPANTIKINVIGTITIFEILKRYEIHSRVVLACSSTEFGTTASLNRPLKETDRLLAVHPYGISKIAAELLARQYYINFEIEAVNLRFFNQTGIRRTNDAPSDFIRQIAQIDLEMMEPTIQVGNLEPYRDFTDIRDSVRAIWLAAIKGTPGETYNVCSGRKIQIRELLETALNFSEKTIEVKEKASKLRETDLDVIVGDNAKIKNELKWDINIPFEKTLKDMYDYWIEIYKKENSRSAK